jgi:hypothetical protein
MTQIKAEATQDRCILDAVVPHEVCVAVAEWEDDTVDVGVTVVVEDIMSPGRTPVAAVTGDRAFWEFSYTVPFPISWATDIIFQPLAMMSG